jgi:hypothetical protein
MFQILRSSSIFVLIFLVILWLLTTIILSQFNLQPYTWEFKNFLIGQNLNQGYRIYKDVRENIGPLSANFYQLIDFLKIPITWNAYLATGIIILQAIIFQRTISRYLSLPDLGNLPFFIYSLFFHFSMEFLVPNGSILGLTFLLLAWNEILAQQSTLKVNDRVFLIGLYIGIASIFFLSYSLFLLWAIVSLLFYSSINARQIILLLVGFSLLFILTGLFFSYRDNLQAFIDVYQNSALVVYIPTTTQIKQIILAYIPAIILGIWGFLKVVNSTKIRSNSQKAQQTNLMWLLTSVMIIFIIPTVERINLVVLMPSLIYFTLNLFYLFKSYWLKELLIIIIIIAMISSLSNEWNDVGKQRIMAQKLTIRNEKLMVLGPQIEEYQNNQMSGPFVNWELSKSLFTNLNQYKTINTLHDYFTKEKPTYIYDPENNFKKLGQYLPELTNQYSLIGRHLYKKINNK